MIHKTIDRADYCKSSPHPTRADSNQFVMEANNVTGCAGFGRRSDPTARQAWHSTAFSGQVPDKQIEVVNE